MTRLVPVKPYRSTVESIGGGVDISIPARRNYVIVAFLVFWLGGWGMGETQAARTLFLGDHSVHAGNTEFLSVWLIAWTIGGAFAVLMLLWTLAGRERVRISSSEVSLRREVFGIGIGKHYDPAQVRNLRSVDTVMSPSQLRTDPFGWFSRPLAFDYGATTVRFGAGIDSAEATHLVERILAASPALRRTTNFAQ